MPRRGENVKQLPNGRWQASYRKLDGNETAKTFDRQADARRWRREGLAAKDRGEHLDPKAGRVTVREFGERWRAAQLHQRPSTAAHLEATLRLHVYPHIGDRPMNRVIRSDIEALVKLWVEQGAAPGTVRHTRCSYLGAMFRAAVKDDVIRKTPCDGIKLPELPPRDMRVLTTAEVRGLADAVDPRYRALILLGHACGLRVSEAVGLTQDRINWFAGEILVDRQLGSRKPYPFAPLKNSRRCPSRVVPLPQHAHQALSRHLEAYGPGDRGLVFVTHRGGPTSGTHVSNIFRPAALSAGLPGGVSFHTLRHSYATELIAQGVSETDVAELIGDSVAMVHQVYGHPSADFRKRAREAMQAAWDAPQTPVADSSRTAGLGQVYDLH
jgi:integrase